MNNVVNNIAKGKNLEVSLPEYANYMMDLYNRAAHMQFTMNYYTYYEVLEEYTGYKKEEIESILGRLNEIVETTVIGSATGMEMEEAIKNIAGLRSEVTATMSILTTFVDIFSRYEYVLNRIEHRFSEKMLPDNYSDEEMTRQIMRYIISDEDNAVINGKISEIIGQLPVRMVKNKFYEYVNKGVNVYSEAGKQSFDDYMYTLRTAALLDRPEGFGEKFGELNEILEKFDTFKFSDITKEQFDELSKNLAYVADATNEMVNIYMMATELINDVYVITLASPYANESEEADICKRIDRQIFDLFGNGEYATIDSDTEAMMIELEGRPERIGAEYSGAEYALDTVHSDYMEMASSVMCSHVYESLFVCQKLLSGSLFVELSENSDDDTLDKEYFENTKKKLIDDIANAFSNHDKMINRSIMSAVLSNLPVFFNNMEEIKEYVMTSLDNCRDSAEKLGCVEIINSIIEAD